MNRAHAYLITGGNQQNRQKEAEKIIADYQGSSNLALDQNPDIFILQSTDSLKIAQIRELKKRLALKPYRQKFKICLILEAEKLTLAAQNALLKTLEEPPESSIIILTTGQPELLLLTIHSRVQVIRILSAGNQLIPDLELSEKTKITEEILAMRLGERIKLAQNFAKTSQEALTFTTQQLYLWRNWLWQKINNGKAVGFLSELSLVNITRTIKKIQKAYIYLNHQVNPHLVIENLLINYPKINSRLASK